MLAILLFTDTCSIHNTGGARASDCISVITNCSAQFKIGFKSSENEVHGLFKNSPTVA